jgi:prepilin-type N-terminal cleavage/methylation domain-containing protein
LRQQQGFTLVEVLIVSVLMVVVLGATLTALTSFQQNTATNTRVNEAQEQVRNGLDLMARDLRNLASPTPNLPQAVDRAEPQDLIFQSEGKVKPAGSLNALNTIRVRFCLDTSSGNLYRQTQTWTSAAAPGVPGGTECPSNSGWTETRLVSEDVVNDARPIFYYNAGSLTAITEVGSTVFVDVNPGRIPDESALQTSVYLRNQNRAPVAVFSVTYLSGTSILMNASESTDPEEKAMFYEWKVDGSSVGDGIVRTETVSPGTHTVSLTVSDGTLTDTAATQSICVPSPSTGVNCP